MPSGDNFIWVPRRRSATYHNQAIPDQILALQPTDEQADILLTNRFATQVRLGAALVQSVAGALAAPHHGADAGDVGQGRQAVPNAYAARWGERIRGAASRSCRVRSRAGGREAGDHREGNHPSYAGTR
jgi:hypothetical protein